MTRHKWAALRAAHLQTPEDRERYAAVRKELDTKLAAFGTLQELVPDSTDLSELWEAVDELGDTPFDSLRRRLWAIAHDRGLVDSPEPPPIPGGVDG